MTPDRTLLQLRDPAEVLTGVVDDQAVVSLGGQRPLDLGGHPEHEGVVGVHHVRAKLKQDRSQGIGQVKDLRQIPP